jgi:hypothetical protein
MTTEDLQASGKIRNHVNRDHKGLSLAICTVFIEPRTTFSDPVITALCD